MVWCWHSVCFKYFIRSHIVIINWSNLDYIHQNYRQSVPAFWLVCAVRFRAVFLSVNERCEMHSSPLAHVRAIGQPRQFPWPQRRLGCECRKWDNLSPNGKHPPKQARGCTFWRISCSSVFNKRVLAYLDGFTITIFEILAVDCKRGCFHHVTVMCKRGRRVKCSPGSKWFRVNSEIYF